MSVKYVRVSLVGSSHHRYEVRSATDDLLGWVKSTPFGWVWRAADGVHWHPGGSRRHDAEIELLRGVQRSSAA